VAISEKKTGYSQIFDKRDQRICYKIAKVASLKSLFACWFLLLLFAWHWNCSLA